MANSLDDLLRQTNEAIGAQSPPVEGAIPTTPGVARVEIPTGEINPALQTAEEPVPGGVVDPNAPKLQTTPDVTGGGPPLTIDQNIVPTQDQQPSNLPVLPPDQEAINADFLSRFDALTNQAMQEKGITYVPPISEINSSPDNQYSAVKAITDIAAGFNYSLASVLSAPRDMVDRGLAMMGLDFMQHGAVQPNTAAALNRMGIPTYKVDNLANKIGRGSLEALATWSAIQIAAPYMAAQQGLGVGQYLMREVGPWALKHPVLGLWLGQTAKAGGTAAEEAIPEGPLKPLGVFGAELAGGMAGQGIVSAGKQVMRPVAAAGRVAGRAVNAIAEGLPTDMANAIKKYNPLYQQPVSPTQASPLITKGLNVQEVQNFAENQVEGLKIQMEDAVARAIEAVPQRGTAAVQQRIFHENLTQAEKISNRIVSEAWDRTPMNTRIPVSEIRRETYSFAQGLQEGARGARPNDLIREILSISSPIRDPASGKMVAAAPTIRRLRGFISDVRQSIAKEQASDAPNGALINNLNKLRDIVEEGIVNQLPRDTTIAQARAASKLHHDMFSRGPIGDVLAQRWRGDFRINPGESVDALTSREGGLQAVRDMARTLSSNRLTTQDERKIINTMVKNAEDAIRAGFREAVDAGGPQAGIRFQKQNEYGIRTLSQVSGELEFAAQKMQTALNIKKEIEASALARFAQTDPEKAVARIFADKNPAGVARQLMRSFRTDKDALEGMRNAILRDLVFNRAGADPIKLKELLDTNRVSNLVREVLSSDQLSRLNRIVNDSIRLTVGEDKSFKSVIKSPAIILGRVLGAGIGRHVSSMMGSRGTLQGPSLFSQATAKQFERIFGGTDPQDMLVMAVLDPAWERMLYSRLPQTTKDMKAAAKNYRRLFATIDSSRAAALKEDQTK